MSGSVSPLPWTGNKGCIYTTIDAFMPPHRTYVEACMGSAEVFLRKKPVEKEIINDYNGDLVRLFRVLQRNENLERLIGRLFLSFNSEQIFRANKALLAEVPNILDDLTETSVIIENTQWNDFDLAVAFYENQVFSFSSTGKNFAITKKDMTKRFGRLIAACARLRNATIMHRDYKDCISYGAGEDAFILLDPPYKGTEDYYQKSSFGSDEHAKLFGFMNEVHEQFHGSCKFLITYNNDPYIRELADHYKRVTWNIRGKRRIVWRCISRLDYGKKYCTESITVDEQALQRAIVRALNRFNVEDEATYLLLMKSTIGEAVGINGSSDEIDLLERRIDALNKRMLDLVSLSVQEGDDAENHEDDFKNISTQIEQLTKRITAIRESESENGDFQARLKEIQDIIDKRRENKDIYDDSIVRQMVECIKVYHDGRLQIILGGGYELEEYLEK